MIAYLQIESISGQCRIGYEETSALLTPEEADRVTKMTHDLVVFALDLENTYRIPEGDPIA